MRFQPIIIDGPARGKKTAVEGYNFMVYMPPLHPRVQDYITESNMSMDITLNEVLYYVHPFKVGQFTFAIASVKNTPPSFERAMKLIFTASARQAVMV